MANIARRTMVMLIGALALWVAVPAAASASPAKWLLSGAPITGSTPVAWSGKIKLSDNEYTGVIECADKAEGSVGASGTGEVTSFTTSECVGVKNCSASGATITPVNLPWDSELTASEGALHDKLVSSGKGTPGFKMECKILGIKVKDECFGTIATTTTNASEGVTATFNTSEKLSCAKGNDSGFLEGSQKITAKGGTLAAKASPPEWLKGGVPVGEESQLILWEKGHLGLYVTSSFGELGVRCETNGEGTVKAGGVGTITEFKLTKCEDGAGSECRGAYSIEAKHLPWKTELAFGEKEAVHESFAADGAGTPGFTLKCEPTRFEHDVVSGECLGVPQAYLTNVTEPLHGVLAEIEGTASECKGEAKGGGSYHESHQTYVTISGGNLSVS